MNNPNRRHTDRPVPWFKLLVLACLGLWAVLLIISF